MKSALKAGVSTISGPADAGVRKVTLAAVAALLLMAPTHAGAAPIVPVSWSYLNSDLTFGFVSPDHAGYDGDAVRVSGQSTAWDPSGSTFQALTGSYTGQTLVTDGGGTVLQSEYYYDGGSFQAQMTLSRQTNGGFDYVTGWFVAPIISLQILVSEEFGGTVDLLYFLGPGRFDSSIARALGVRRHTLGGDAYGWLYLTDAGNRPGIAGDHTTPVRQAWDGYTDWTVYAQVPEPSSLLLTALGLGAVSYGRHRRSVPPPAERAHARDDRP